MIPLRLLLALCCLSALPVRAQTAADRLYGTVTTRHGDTFEGLIRWDQNEVSWVDVLDGSRRPETGHRRAQRFEIFGIRFEMGGSARASGIRFGHIRRIENVGADHAEVVLRSGQRIELFGGASDIGHEVRSIVVEDAQRGEVALRWRDVDAVEFRPAPPEAASRFGARLYGTLTTSRGDAFTGYVCWDVDEVLAADPLDGNDDRGRRHRIPFGDIASVERQGSGSARVLLHSGEDVVLHGSNDVNRDNRGILILDPTLGQIRIDWDDFERLDLERPASTFGYQDFRSAGPLRGTVYTRSGDRHTGAIRWDDDEAYGWELLNGVRDGIAFAVEFNLIREIERLSDHAAFLVLRDGRTLELTGSNDVDERNHGIYVTRTDGETVRIDWDDFARVVLDAP